MIPRETNPHPLAGAGRDAKLMYPRAFYPLGRDSLVAMNATPHAPLPNAGLHTLGGLEKMLAAERVLPLGALIFHCSRCGSTLLSRILALEPGNRVFVEPSVLPQFLEAIASELSPGHFHSGLRTFIQAFGLLPQPGEERLIIKLSSPALRYIASFRACFPGVPFIYLLRDPVAVAGSLQANPPPSLCYERRTAIAAYWNESGQERWGDSPAEWYAWYVNRNMRFALRHAPEFSAVIDYGNFATPYLELASSLSGRSWSADMPEVAKTFAHYSKRPTVTFQPRLKPPPAFTATVESIAGETYFQWQEKLQGTNRPSSDRLG